VLTPPLRFRPNIVLEGAGTPYVEEEWEEIGFENSKPDGGPSTEYGRMVCISRCTRCQVRELDITRLCANDALLWTREWLWD
jgi:MOSC domain